MKLAIYATHGKAHVEEFIVFTLLFNNSGAHETIEHENDELVEGLSQKVDALRSVRTYSAWPTCTGNALTIIRFG